MLHTMPSYGGAGGVDGLRFVFPDVCELLRLLCRAQEAGFYTVVLTLRNMTTLSQYAARLTYPN